MALTEQQSVALEASIKHWEENLLAEHTDDVDVGPQACALCLVFYPKRVTTGTGCQGCPVAEATGQSYCRGSPYHEAKRMFAGWYMLERFGMGFPDAKDVWRQAAKKEVEFLKSLRDPIETDEQIEADETYRGEVKGGMGEFLVASIDSILRQNRHLSMTPEQRELARHALGLPNRAKKSYRNRFVTGEGSADHPHWLAMVEGGHAVRRKGNALTGGNDLFLLTREGAKLALDKREKLDAEAFPTVSAQAEPPHA